MMDPVVTSSSEPSPQVKHDKIKLVEINTYLTCYLCKGYLIDATTISECLHSFCRSCIIKFLQENCYCPVCEVIINKAKPCLKLDKTLQDIVYKLVPELFVREMLRRQQFYRSRPNYLALKVSPEERGEDTERTIYNPQDAISLSIEYISDDSSPGAIPMLSTSNNSVNKTMTTASLDDQQHQSSSLDNPMKRYLQCPAMCRIEVLKKFVRNKYNVDTNLFHIDVLYKRVPLPDHYTLIDIGYIYSWKRNEPMKFYFRITDLTKVAERFDYFDATKIKETPPLTAVTKKTKHAAAPSHHQHHVQHHKTITTTTTKPSNKVPSIVNNNNNNNNKSASEVFVKKTVSSGVKRVSFAADHTNKKVTVVDTAMEEKVASIVKKVADTIKKESVQKKSESAVVDIDKIKSKVQNENKTTSSSATTSTTTSVTTPTTTLSSTGNGVGDNNNKNHVYTNITLNRDDNVEIITKIQKVNNKAGLAIGLNIINHTVKKTNKLPNVSSNASNVTNNGKTKMTFASKLVPMATNPYASAKPPPPTFSYRSACQQEKEERMRNELKEKEEMEKKSNFFKSIELTAKNTATSTTVVSDEKTDDVKPSITPPPPALNSPLSSMSSPKTPSPPSSGKQKRKNSSPVKVNDTSKNLLSTLDSGKKLKISSLGISENKRPLKIIIQPKNIQNPAVRQIVSNVNQNVNHMSKIVEQTTPTSKQNSADIKTLIDNCKINIPASLSITLNEGGDGGARTPPSMPPVKNYIEILKLPECENEMTGNAAKLSPTPSPVIPQNKEQQQKVEVKKSAPPVVLANKEETAIPLPPPTKHQLYNTKNPNSYFEKAFLGYLGLDLGENNNKNGAKKALDLTSSSTSDVTSTVSGGGKRKISEIASALQKKTKLENQDTVAGDLKCAEVNKTKSPKSPNQMSATLHSPTLGFNYTVSVGQPDGNAPSGGTALATATSPGDNTAKKDTPSAPSGSTKTSAVGALSPTQLLEKYNIQNLAQLTASLNFPANATSGNTAGCFNAALQHAMFLKQLERHHHQSGHVTRTAASWMQSAAPLFYDKYVQSLAGAAGVNKKMNIKEN